MRVSLLLLASLCYGVSAYAQKCPAGVDDQQIRSVSYLHGTVRLHNDLRQWLGLELDKPACGEDEIQLVFASTARFRQAERFRECEVTVASTLFESPTGYYSAKIATSDPRITPDASCRPKPLKPDSSHAPIAKGLSSYFARVTVNYSGKGRITAEILRSPSSSHSFTPIEAYIEYDLSGGLDVMNFSCRKGFHVSVPSISPPSKYLPSSIDSGVNANLYQAVLDPDRVNVVSFTCNADAKRQ